MDDASIAWLLSPERLAPFLTITGAEHDAIALHNQSIRLNAAIMPVVALIEIGLRNAISEQLRTKLRVPNWLTAPPPSRLAWHGKEKDNIKKAILHAQRAAYAKLTHAEKKALDAKAYPKGIPPGLPRSHRIKARQKQIAVGVGQTIAQLTLSFWKGLFSADYEAVLWKPVLRRLFPNKAIGRADVARHLEVIYEARNRIAHHEALLGGRLESLLESIDYIAQNFGATLPSTDAVMYRMTAPFRALLETEAEATRALINRYALAPLGSSKYDARPGDT